ncbi:23S rRNA (uridine(2552)-2'-O)-methyltransferase RlmE [Granulosicoccaceae sp. 1_MG-2023]|nr:23S rRNA (uridine(2552)-2'-O)-methyltransferase RlmE [Granulosicoccaceae sp. 1_MG-2023]
MARSKSSNRWLQEHFSDDFVQRSKSEHYRSRAVYKLIELDEKDNLLRPGLRILELGAAPGGWTQYIAEKLDGRGTIVASDILPMDTFADIRFVQGDFREDAVLQQILSELGDAKADLVLSDMAPNLTGVAATDQARSMYLAELALDTAQQVLDQHGVFVTKLFQGEGFPAYMEQLKTTFQKAVIRKPKASRARSREVYAVASGLRI